jgi:hypothetical protein
MATVKDGQSFQKFVSQDWRAVRSRSADLLAQLPMQCWLQLQFFINYDAPTPRRPGTM